MRRRYSTLQVLSNLIGLIELIYKRNAERKAELGRSIIDAKKRCADADAKDSSAGAKQKNEQIYNEEVNKLHATYIQDSEIHQCHITTTSCPTHILALVGFELRTQGQQSCVLLPRLIGYTLWGRKFGNSSSCS